MGSLDRPKLRPLPASRFEWDGRLFVKFDDPAGVVSDPVLIPLDAYQRVVRHFDGRTTLPQVLDRIRSETGQDVEMAELVRLVTQLDQAMVLDGPRFDAFHQTFRRGQVRPPALAGRSYPATERALREELASYFTHARGSGHPTPSPAKARGRTRLRGVLSPHIDYQRGGPTYSWAYRELAERSDAEVFVVLGVAHQACVQRFALTRKDFDTPLGTLATDRAYVDLLAERAGKHLFDDELAHRTEHSIEFQAVFLKYMFPHRRNIAMVPVLVGSFHDLMDAGVDPIDDDEVSRFIAALREAERRSGKKVAYIGAVDLSHIGPEFGDPAPVDDAQRERLERFDQAMLDRVAANDPRGWFETAARVGNRWRVCGLAATYTMLHALGRVRGRVARYDQAIDDRGQCCVSFASTVFEAERE